MRTCSYHPSQVATEHWETNHLSGLLWRMRWESIEIKGQKINFTNQAILQVPDRRLRGIFEQSNCFIPSFPLILPGFFLPSCFFRLLRSHICMVFGPILIPSIPNMHGTGGRFFASNLYGIIYSFRWELDLYQPLMKIVSIKYFSCLFGNST